MNRLTLLLAPVVLALTFPAFADVVFTDSAMPLTSYTQTPAYSIGGASLSVSNGGGGLDVTVNATASGGSVAGSNVGLVNNTFTYNPATQGAIEEINFSVSTNFTTSVPAGPTQIPSSAGCTVLLEQDGNFYLAFLSGPSFSGSASGFLTCSGTGLTASNFSQYNFSTGAATQATPNFSGDPFKFGIMVSLFAQQNATLGNISNSLNIDLVTTSSPAALSPAPSYLTFSPLAGSTAPLQQTVTIQNTGGVAATIGASTQFNSKWLSIGPLTAVVQPGKSASFLVTVNPQLVTVWNSRDVIQFKGTNVAAVVPVSLYLPTPGPALFAGPGGFLFTMIQGASSSMTQNLIIVNQGTSGSTLNWTAGPATIPGFTNGNFLNIGATGGSTQAGASSTDLLTLNSNASALTPGVYYELVQVSAPGAQNPLAYAVAVLNIVSSSSTIPAQITPAALLFVGAVASAIPSQKFALNTGSNTPEPAAVETFVDNGQNWLQVSPSGATATGAVPALFTVSVETYMSAGVCTGSISVGEGQFGYISVAMILTPSVTSSAGLSGVHALATTGKCTPSTVVMIATGVPNSFTVPAGWPSDLIATMTDDCGSPVNNGAISANFSDGDPPLALTPSGSGGQYISTWQPSKATNATITLQGSAPSLAPAVIQLSGFVTANQAPVLAQNGILNNLNPLVGAPLAPGTVAAAYGSGLTTSQTPVSPNTSPLQNQFQSTELVVGGSIAPLYFLSTGQLNVEIPAELTSQQQVPAVAVVNNALSLPVILPLTPVGPGVAVNADGSVIAQDSNFNLITASSPAHPNQPIVIYVVGMGATDPAVPSGQPAPGTKVGDTLAQAVVQPVVMVNNQTAQILYAGLTPGAIGLYQINFIVPGATPSGNMSLTVTQGAVSANATTLPVVAP